MILFVTRIPPKADGHGGSQRAMHMLRSLLLLGPVDLLYLYRDGDADAGGDALAQARPLVGACVAMELPEWASPHRRWPGLSWRSGLLAEIVLRYCAESPRLSARTLRAIAAALPRRRYEVVFAGRLPCATAADALLAAGLIDAGRKVVDLDDIMSRFRERQLATEGPVHGRLWHLAQRIDIRRIRRRERDVLLGWQGVSVCTEEDVALLQARVPEAHVHRVPNVVDRPLLAPGAGAALRVLFVGSLAFNANLVGLRAFVEGAWGRIKHAVPGARLTVVGMLPSAEVAAELRAAGADLHADVLSVEPYYRDCDIVIAPILFGGGTRIKILEAMAYGRAVVSTTIGAEGLEIVPGRDMLIADAMPDFADAVIRLGTDPALRGALAQAARAHQQQRFGPTAMHDAVATMVTGEAAN